MSFEQHGYNKHEGKTIKTLLRNNGFQSMGVGEYWIKFEDINEIPYRYQNIFNKNDKNLLTNIEDFIKAARNGLE